MFSQSPVVISGDPVILILAAVGGLSLLGLFVIKVSDKWQKYRQNRQKRVLEKSSKKAIHDLTN